eukprot:13765338-Ditylum_brightwellii.AAC.1
MLARQCFKPPSYLQLLNFTFLQHRRRVKKSLKIAIGNSIAINTIMGYPFLSSAGFKLDLNNLTAESVEFVLDWKVSDK